MILRHRLLLTNRGKLFKKQTLISAFLRTLINFFVKSLPWPLDIRSSKIYFYRNIFLSQYLFIAISFYRNIFTSQYLFITILRVKMSRVNKTMHTLLWKLFRSLLEKTELT